MHSCEDLPIKILSARLAVVRNGSLPAITPPTPERPRTAPSGSSADELTPAQHPRSHRPPEPPVSYTKHNLCPSSNAQDLVSFGYGENDTMSTNASDPGAWSEPHSNFSGQGCHEYSFRGHGQYGPGMVSPRAAGEKVDGRVSMQTAGRMPRRDQLLSSMSSTMSSRGHGPPLIQTETMPKRPTSSQRWMGRTTLVSSGRLPLKRPLRLTCVRVPRMEVEFAAK